MAAVILAVIVLIIKIFLPCCCSFIVSPLLPSFVEHLSRPPVPGAGHGKDSNIKLSWRCTWVRDWRIAHLTINGRRPSILVMRYREIRIKQHFWGSVCLAGLGKGYHFDVIIFRDLYICIGCRGGNLPKPGDGASKYEVAGFCLRAKLYKNIVAPICHHWNQTRCLEVQLLRESSWPETTGRESRFTSLVLH